MTPAINLVKKSKVPHTVHSYTHDSAAPSYGLEAAEKLNIPHQQVFKTLVISLESKEFAIGVIPVNAMLNMKQIARAADAKGATMAAKADAERITGYVLGGVSPLGQKKRLRTFVDASAQEYATIYVSAGRRGLEIELAPDDLGTLTSATFAPLCQ